MVATFFDWPAKPDMRVVRTEIPEVVAIHPEVHGDQRGFFVETFQARRYAEEAGISLPFVQDNRSRSGRHVLRGLHFQRRYPQGKLVSVVSGAVFDVAVDIRPKSATFGKWVGFELTADNHVQLWVPPGFAHGFVVLSESADFSYKCTEYYRADDEGTIAWNDPDIGITWPVKTPLISEKDARAGRLRDLVQ